MHCPCGLRVVVDGNLIKHKGGGFCPWLNTYNVNYMDVPMENELYWNLRSLAFEEHGVLGTGFLASKIRKLIRTTDSNVK